MAWSTYRTFMFLLPITDENQRNNNILILDIVAQKGVPLLVMLTIFEPSTTIFVLTCVKKILGVDLCTTCCLHIWTHRGPNDTGMWLQEDYEEKKWLHRILVSISSLWAQMPRQQGAYRYMGCSARDSLGTNVLVVFAPLKTDAHFFDP